MPGVISKRLFGIRVGAGTGPVLSLLLQSSVRHGPIICYPGLDMAQIPRVHRHIRLADQLAGREIVLQEHTVPRAQRDCSCT